MTDCASNNSSLRNPLHRKMDALVAKIMNTPWPLPWEREETQEEIDRRPFTVELNRADRALEFRFRRDEDAKLFADRFRQVMADDAKAQTTELDAAALSSNGAVEVTMDQLSSSERVAALTNSRSGEKEDQLAQFQAELWVADHVASGSLDWRRLGGPGYLRVLRCRDTTRRVRLIFQTASAGKVFYNEYVRASEKELDAAVFVGIGNGESCGNLSDRLFGTQCNPVPLTRPAANVAWVLSSSADCAALRTWCKSATSDPKDCPKECSAHSVDGKSTPTATTAATTAATASTATTSTLATGTTATGTAPTATNLHNPNSISFASLAPPFAALAMDAFRS